MGKVSEATYEDFKAYIAENGGKIPAVKIVKAALGIGQEKVEFWREQYIAEQKAEAESKLASFVTDQMDVAWKGLTKAMLECVDGYKKEMTDLLRTSSDHAEQMSSQITDLENELANARKSLDVAKQENSGLKATVEERSQALNEAKRGIEKEVKDAAETIQRLTAETEKTKASLVSAEKERNLLEIALEETKQVARDAKCESDKCIADLKMQIENLTSELNAALNAQKVAEAKEKAAGDTANALQDAKKNAEAATTNAEQARIEAEKRHRIELADAEAKALLAQKEKQELEVNLQKEISVLKDRLVTTKEELEKAQGGNVQRKRVQKMIATRNSKLVDDNKALKAKLADLKREQLPNIQTGDIVTPTSGGGHESAEETCPEIQGQDGVGNIAG